MQTTYLTGCKQCVSIPDLIKAIDCKISKIGIDIYNNIAFSLNKNVDNSIVTKLVIYRRILNYKYYSDNYICDIDIQTITNKVIKLTAGCKTKCLPNIKCN